MSLDKSSTTERYVLSFYESLDCPRSLTCAILYRNAEFSQLVNLELDPSHYDKDLNNSFADSLAATKFLSKSEFIDCKIDRRKVSLETFIRAEKQCRITNHRFVSGYFIYPETPSILSMARRKIELVLGSFTAEEFVDSCGWGPGASTLMKRRDATQPEKFLRDGGITKAAHDFVSSWFSLAYPSWDAKFQIQAGNKVVTVPKNAKTDRVIAIEPGINLWFQKGIGALIRKRLRYYGIDLNNGQEHHGRLAKLSSKTNHLATVDFSSASDTISYEVVRDLLPLRWFTLLECFRSSSGTLGSETIAYAKFSSMGNGYTFELESLIFWAFATSVCEYLNIKGSISVYGDDVILPSEAFDLYSKVCEDSGFTVNTSKSYHTGGYRESCGSHYYFGADVKPIFQKEPLNGKTAILKAANNVRRLAHRRNTYGCDSRFRDCWQLLASYVGRSAPRISEHYGDIGLIENINHPSVKVVKAKHGVEGFHVRVWAVQALQRFVEHEGLLLYRLKTIGHLNDGASGNDVSMPLRTRHAKIRVLIPRWYDLGPWM